MEREVFYEGSSRGGRTEGGGSGALYLRPVRAHRMGPRAKLHLQNAKLQRPTRRFWEIELAKSVIMRLRLA